MTFQPLHLDPCQENYWLIECQNRFNGVLADLGEDDDALGVPNDFLKERVYGALKDLAQRLETEIPIPHIAGSAHTVEFGWEGAGGKLDLLVSDKRDRRWVQVEDGVAVELPEPDALLKLHQLNKTLATTA